MLEVPKHNVLYFDKKIIFKMIPENALDLIIAIVFWYCATTLSAYLLGTVANRFLKQSG
jgi:hypothetical protein